MRPLILAVLLATAGIAAMVYWDRHTVSSGHMKPTLLVGDHILVESVSGSDLERGDVITFTHTTRKGVFFFRLIGLPGEQVQMKNGILYLDDVAVDVDDNGIFAEVMAPQGSRASKPLCANYGVALGENCEKERRTETLPNGVSYAVLNVGERATDVTTVFTVPEGHYFVLGDNRDNSADSRLSQADFGMGFIPAENVRGRVARVLFSSAGRSLAEVWNWRSDRYFKEVR